MASFLTQTLGITCGTGAAGLIAHTLITKHDQAEGEVSGRGGRVQSHGTAERLANGSVRRLCYGTGTWVVTTARR